MYALPFLERFCFLLDNCLSSRSDLKQSEKPAVLPEKLRLKLSYFLLLHDGNSKMNCFTDFFF